MRGPLFLKQIRIIPHKTVTLVQHLVPWPQAAGIDALAQTDWAMEHNFINPPFHIIPQVLAKMKQAETTLIASRWPSQPCMVQHIIENGHSYSASHSTKTRYIPQMASRDRTTEEPQMEYFCLQNFWQERFSQEGLRK